MTKPDPEMIDHELPELADDFFARARPASETMGEAFMARAQQRDRLRGLLLEGASSPPGETADRGFFASLRRRVRRLSGKRPS